MKWLSQVFVMVSRWKVSTTCNNEDYEYDWNHYRFVLHFTLIELGGIEDHRPDLDTFLIQTNFPQLRLTLDKIKAKNNGKSLEQELDDRLKREKKNTYTWAYVNIEYFLSQFCLIFLRYAFWNVLLKLLSNFCCGLHKLHGNSYDREYRQFW